MLVFVCLVTGAVLFTLLKLNRNISLKKVPMKILVDVKRVVDYNVRVRV